jgi:hypothetical protein
MVGGTVFEGALTVTTTTWVCAELAVLEPTSLRAVTETRIVAPTSSSVST